MMNKPTKSEFSFRRFLILLATVLGALYLSLNYTPRLTVFIFILIIGIFFLGIAIAALRDGYVKINAQAKIVTYSQSDNPLVFWFYVFLCFIFGILICCLGICFLPGKFNIFRAFFKL